MTRIVATADPHVDDHEMMEPVWNSNKVSAEHYRTSKTSFAHYSVPSNLPKKGVIRI